jgi:2-iminobutanoate/2-iminopropanoate deaminase
MQKKIVKTGAAPAAAVQYSQAVETNGVLYLSGMLPLDPATGAMVGSDIPAQASQILKNIAALLESQGLSTANIVKTTAFLTDFSAFSAFNAVYGETFSANPPARSCVEVSRLPKDALVEIECVAVR